MRVLGDMNMKKLHRITSVILVIILVLLTCSCANPPDNQLLEQPVQLPAPQNIRSEGKVIFWDAVENATGYVVNFENTEYETQECSLDLSFYEDLGTYQIEIKALGDDKNYTDSEWASFSYTAKEPTDPGVTDQPTNPGGEDGPVKAGYDEQGLAYYLLEDGSGYAVTRGKLDYDVPSMLPETIVIPESYGGLPVKEIRDHGFATFIPGKIINGMFVEGSGYLPKPFEENPRGNIITKKVILPSTLERIGEAAFAGLFQLEEIIIPDSVTEIGMQAFWACRSLKKVTLPKNLKEIPDECFMHCGLTEITLPDGLETIGKNAFCARGSVYENGKYVQHYTSQNLTEIIIPDSVKHIGAYAFLGCQKLSQVDLPESLESMGHSVFEDTALWNEHPDGVIYIDNVVCGYRGEMPENTAIHIPETVTGIAAWAFYGQDNLKSVYISDGVKLLGEKIFSGCSSLSEVRLPADLKEIPNQTFQNCQTLAEILLPDKLTAIRDKAFSGCTSLSKVNLPESITEIEDGAFSKCALEEVTLPANLEMLGGAFSSCYKLKKIIIPKSVEFIGNGVFRTCTSLESVFYEGKLEDWIAILDKGISNDSFSDATIYFYSESEPTEEGSFWHYVDGKATPWEKAT